LLREMPPSKAREKRQQKLDILEAARAKRHAGARAAAPALQPLATLPQQPTLSQGAALPLASVLAPPIVPADAFGPADPPLAAAPLAAAPLAVMPLAAPPHAVPQLAAPQHAAVVSIPDESRDELPEEVYLAAALGGRLDTAFGRRQVADDMETIESWLRSGGSVDARFYGEDWNAPGEPGGGGTLQRTLLMGAASDGNVALVHELVRLGASLDLQDSEGSTALMCGLGTLDVTTLLLRAGADTTLRDGSGMTAYEMMVEDISYRREQLRSWDENPAAFLECRATVCRERGPPAHIVGNSATWVPQFTRRELVMNLRCSKAVLELLAGE